MSSLLCSFFQQIQLTLIKRALANIQIFYFWPGYVNKTHRRV